MVEKRTKKIHGCITSVPKKFENWLGGSGDKEKALKKLRNKLQKSVNRGKGAEGLDLPQTRALISDIRDLLNDKASYSADDFKTECEALISRV